MVQLHDIKTTRIRKKARVGRGGKRGKTSGRGTKGQKARAGHRIRPEIRDFISRTPKLRGYTRNRAKSVIGSKMKAISVNLDVLDRYFNDGDVVSTQTLLEKGIIKTKSGKPEKAKILARGEITKKITIEGLSVSEQAKEKIEKAGGKVNQ